MAAKEKLPPAFKEKSGVGVHYADAFVKPMNTELADGTKVSCKRKGLKITLKVGEKRERPPEKLDVRDPVEMLQAALLEAAKAAGVQLQITDKETSLFSLLS